jgi:hypothetical protein
LCTTRCRNRVSACPRCTRSARKTFSAAQAMTGGLTSLKAP